MPKLVGRKWLARRKCVGVVGLLQAGKTVLITALVNHFKEHQPRDFPLFAVNGTPGCEVLEVKELKPSSKAEWFDFRQQHSRMAGGKWPLKTVRLEEYRGLYKLEGGGRKGRSLVDLSFLDIPGERLADLSIAENAQYGDWSEQTLRTFFGCLETQDAARVFHDHLDQVQKSETVDEGKLLAAYRETLARLIVACQPIVRPSTFLVDKDGNPPDQETKKASDQDRIQLLTVRRHAGLSVDKQFAPLPAWLRERHRDLAHRFDERYREYRKKLALPLAAAIGRCDDLLFVVDIATLLEASDGMLNANHVLLEEVLTHIEPGWTRWGRLAKRSLFAATAGRFALGGVGRIAFVASKADRVAQEDREQLSRLLDEMTRGLIKPYRATRRLTVKQFVCAAISTTKSMDGNRTLQFLEKGETRSVVPSKIPSEWPHHWSHGDYLFPSPRPVLPTVRHKAPEHIHLNHVAEFVLQ